MAEKQRTNTNTRRWKQFLLGAVGVLLLLLLIYPLWLPWVLKPVAARLGLQFAEYHRQGYARFELRNLNWADETVSVRAEQVSLQMPHRWLWTRLGRAVGADPQVVVQSWRVELKAPVQPSTGGIGSTGELLNEAQNVAPLLSQWIHSIVLTNGEVLVAGSSVAIPSIRLRDEVLTVDALTSQAVVELSGLAAASVDLSLSNELATAGLALQRQEAKWVLKGGVDWQSNRLELSGWFDGSSWLPTLATVDCPSLQLSSSQIGLDQFPDMQGSASAVWSNSAYSFALQLADAPGAAPGLQLEQISLKADGVGDLREVELNRLELTAPFLKFTLDQPLTFDFGGSVEGRTASLQLWADLSRVEDFGVEGQLSGIITVQPTIHSPFRAGFNLRGTNVAGAGLQAESLAMGGRLDWPLLQVTNLTAGFESGGKFVADLVLEIGKLKSLASVAPQGSTVHSYLTAQNSSVDPAVGSTNQRDAGVSSLAGGGLLAGWNLRELNWQFDGPLPLPLPEWVKLQAVHASGTARGHWPELTHSGRLEVEGVESGPFRVATGRVNWTGHGLQMERIESWLKNGSSTLEFAGKGGCETSGDGIHVTLEGDALKLVTAEGVWELTEPFQFAAHRQTNGLAVDLSTLELVGPESRLAAQGSVLWPVRGVGTITLQGLRSSSLGDFLAPELPGLQVPEAALTFSWDDGPLQFELDGGAQWRQSSNAVWSATARARADGQSLQFDALRVELNAEPCVELTGGLPLRIEPAMGWRVRESGAVEAARFEVSVVESGPLWTMFEERAGVRIASPDVEFHAAGEFPEITGELLVHAAQVRLAETNINAAIVVPELEDIQIEVVLGLGGVELRRADAQLLGQTITAQANWDIHAADWTELLSALRAPDWKQISGRLRMERAELSALSAVVPGLLAPQGIVDLDLALEPGLKVNGHLSLTNGATRFLKPLGTLRDLEADITVEGWTAKVHTLAATLGGRPIALRGDLELRADGDRRFDLRLTGENLSLVRDPELFLRADLDLRLQKSFEEIARLTGDVQLRRSLLFRDFNSLISLDQNQPQGRPPYFSVPQPPFGDWTLDVRVKGDRFLSVFSPAFKGEVSAGLQLLGTLREPLAVGAVTVDNGKILFPFGTLQMENGRVDLTREDPYRPRLDFKGQGQNFGYTVTVDLRGPLDAPNLTFQSVPPLNAQQILMMLTAGEIPRSDFGYDTTDKVGTVGFYVGKEFVNRFIGNTSTTERLELRSGENVTQDGKVTYSIQYRLTDRWSAFGEYDRFQNVNSGLKFKVLSK